ncbi:transposase [Tetragenococcus halophilus subsp. flandriensis]|nr:transposase [Tetragenococcus halophilus subsp. flandriensis]
MTERDNNLLNITWLCEIAQVSRSGFYAWKENADKRAQREAQDRADFELILAAYRYRGFKKGSRSIYMRLLHTGARMNRKKIQRLMRKYGLSCPIRKANPYRRIAKAVKEHAIFPNVLNRQFKATGPKTVLLTDVTYLFYGRQQKAYLSTIKDAYTHQILAYTLSSSLEEDFILETIHQLYEKHSLPKNFNALIHSDQGVHYTNRQFQTLVQNQQLRQSMSRRGNCWDNAPQESFFGHMKDELSDLAGLDSYAQVQTMIDDYMDYYNNERYQWTLAKCAPNQYAQYIKTGDHPLQSLHLKRQK